MEDNHVQRFFDHFDRLVAEGYRTVPVDSPKTLQVGFVAYREKDGKVEEERHFLKVNHVKEGANPEQRAILSSTEKRREHFTRGEEFPAMSQVNVIHPGTHTSLTAAFTEIDRLRSEGFTVIPSDEPTKLLIGWVAFKEKEGSEEIHTVTVSAYHVGSHLSNLSEDERKAATDRFRNERHHVPLGSL